MKRRIRVTTRVALWSGLLAAAVMVVFVLVVKVAHRRLAMRLMDAELRQEVEHFLDQYEHHGSKLEWVTPRGFRATMPAVRDPHIFSEAAGADGRVLASSRSLGGRTLGALPPGSGWVEFDGQRVRAFAAERGGLLVRIASDLAQQRDEERVLNGTLLLALPLAVLCVGLGAWLVARRALRPLREMAGAAGWITADRLSERLEESPVLDEIGQLSRAFNASLERLEGSFAAAARFSADASHELKTPLAVARAGLGDLFSDPELAPHHQQRVAEALEHVGRLTDITESLLLLSRADAGRLGLAGGCTDAAATVRELVVDFSPLAEERDVKLEAEVCATAPAHAAPWALRMVVMNLLDNAIKYNAEAGRISVVLEAVGGSVMLRVGNTGAGIAPEDAAHVFDRFFRSAHTAEIPGSGLGLSLARELARAMGGELALTASRPGWTEFTLTLRGEG